jgi:hypothetical protein
VREQPAESYDIEHITASELFQLTGAPRMVTNVSPFLWGAGKWNSRETPAMIFQHQIRMQSVGRLAMHAQPVRPGSRQIQWLGLRLETTAPQSWGDTEY